MNQTYEMSLALHLFFSKAVLGLLIVHLGLVFVENTAKFGYIKRLMLFLPFYYMILSFIFFTGFLNLAFLHFNFSPKIWLMIVFWVALIPLGAIGFKKLKKLKFNKNFAHFKKFMFFKIICEILLIAAAVFVGIKL